MSASKDFLVVRYVPLTILEQTFDSKRKVHVWRGFFGGFPDARGSTSRRGEKARRLLGRHLVVEVAAYPEGHVDDCIHMFGFGAEVGDACALTEGAIEDGVGKIHATV